NNGGTGIKVGVEEYAYILDNNVTDNGAGGIDLSGVGGDELFEFNNNWVDNNTGNGIFIIGFGAGTYENNMVKDNSVVGLWLSQVNNLLIEDQIFEGNGNLAININAEGSNIIIRNVTMRYNYGGIQLISGDDQNFTVEDSWIYGNTASLEDTYWTGIYIIDYNLTDGYITLVNNNISNNENSTGIYIEAWETQGAYVNITGNDIINNDGGIHYWAYEPGAEVDIIDNVVKDNPGGLGGITAANQRTATIINNEVVNNGIGISAGYSWGSIDEYVLVLDNYLKNNTGGIILSGVEGNETFDVENNWVENSGGGTSLTNFEDGLFTNNTMKEDTDYGNGLYLSGVDDSVFKDSYFLGFYSGAAVQDSYGNLIYNNYFNNTNDYGEAVYDFGANDWNTSVQPGPNIIGGPFLGGNYYTFYDEPYSPEFCYDVLFYDGNPGNDGFCDSNYSIPYGSNKDYHPLTWPTDQDYGDAPAPYPTLFGNDGARHILNSSLYLGASIDIETNGQPNPTATGDGEDEDGVSFDSPLHAGALVFITVNASASGYLDAWVDFDGDEEWDDPDERIFNKTSLSSGANSLNFTIPSGASLGYTYARFRFSSTGELSPAGFANDGEVEDYRIYIDEEPPAPVVPEFSTTTIILAILVIGLGITLIAVKKKQ
ncbi:right-handed parallel beta-helix repeat-containing protein, partial [Candidatus Woesearchaeota archaeon]|nr:right-handed parallel beta-helix repeat-containing protein [Candidatus Woesearchaeota archaeon]